MIRTNIAHRIILCHCLALVALAAYGKPARKPSAAELMAEARAAFYNYDPSLALQKIGAVRQLKKGFDADSLAALEQKAMRMDEMMQRVEDVVVIDSMTVNRDDFFRHYRLAPSAGTLNAPADFGIDGNTVVYEPQDATWMVWGGETGLMQAQRLANDTWEAPEPMGDVLNYGGIANYPFVLTDGTTLYYATEGDDSLGGLDLYMSRSDRGEFTVPQNLGMPYNSPYDDYMLAIDEETGAGWFASDRNQLDDLVTIYVFIPTQRRVNLDVDTPNLAARAKIVVTPDADSERVLQKIADIVAPDAYVDEPEFTFVFPSGEVYTHWEQFRKDQARRLMETYIDALEAFEADQKRLNIMRRTFKPTDAETVLVLEKKVKASRATLRRIANQVIMAEHGAN